MPAIIATVPDDPRPHRGARTWRRPSVAVGGWVALVVATNVWGQVLVRAGRRLYLPTPPLAGSLQPFEPARVLLPLVTAVVVAAAVIVWGPSLALRMRWRALLVSAAVAAAVWAVALALVDPRGPEALLRPLRLPTETYRVTFPAGALDFVRHYIARLPTYPVQLRGHPPGMALVVWALRQAGLRGEGWTAALVIGAWAAAVPAALAAVAMTAGRDAARRAAPFLVLGPTALWVATSADALFAAVATVAIFAFVAASTAASRRRGDLLGAGSGVAFGVGLFLTYGVAPLALVFVVVAAARRQWRTLAVAAAASTVVAVGFAAAGFWWVEGLRATRMEVLRDAAHTRPYGYFLVADLAAFAIAVGPAAVAGLTQARSRAWLLTGAVAAALALVDLSGLIRGEVERIWLPYAPWLLVAAAALPGGERVRQRWLVGQAAVAIALQVALHFPW